MERRDESHGKSLAITLGQLSKTLSWNSMYIAKYRERRVGGIAAKQSRSNSETGTWLSQCHTHLGELKGLISHLKSEMERTKREAEERLKDASRGR